MLALFSRFFRRLRFRGVRALKLPSQDHPCRQSFHLLNGSFYEISPGMIEVNGEVLHYGHFDRVEITIKSANERQPQPVETPEKSANNKEGER
jgi:hypothetical protein